jgi:hypothetical protein
MLYLENSLRRDDSRPYARRQFATVMLCDIPRFIFAIFRNYVSSYSIIVIRTEQKLMCPIQSQFIIISLGLPKGVLCSLGGLVVSVLVTGPKGCGFEPGKAMDF